MIRREPPSVEQLLEHRTWVRGLVRTLVLDESSADDVEQQVWVSALEGAPAVLEQPRAWLTTVARNRARRARRGAVCRTRREAAVARPERQPSTAELAERAEAHRNVVHAVEALSPPLREVVLLHHFDGLTTPETAARVGVPHETVRSRLRLARERLRTSLREPARSRAAWSPALLLVAGLPRDFVPVSAAASSSTAGGALAMAVSQKLIESAR